MTDRELVESFLKSRSERDFRALYRSVAPALYRMALRLAANRREDADELMQETWMVGIRKLHLFEWRSSLNTWLTGILINLSRKKYLASAAQNVELADLISPHSVDDVLDLEQAMEKLPPGYRQVIVLHDVEGYKHHEIAGMLEISEGTSKSQLFQARKSLRKLLSK